MIWVVHDEQETKGNLDLYQVNNIWAIASNYKNISGILIVEYLE